jgi:erythronate-4-phosphate dehydrogenase
MKIVADDKIPFLKGVLEPYAQIEYLPGHLINNSHLKDADALLTRTRTPCNRNLLEGTAVKFIGTATIGYDHIDTAYCDKHQITWKNAPGCNASSVSQYIAAALVHLSRRFGFSLKDRVLGVVGVGNVGSKVVHFAEMIGMQVYLCDPPRVRDEGICGFISLDGIRRECDIITFHVPLNLKGKDKTFHMIDHDFLAGINKGTFIINTSRGEVADGIALKEAFSHGRPGGFILDVWENEPEIDTDLLEMAVLGTPHIAGYSADGKAKGTAMIVSELSNYFDLGIHGWEPASLPVPEQTDIYLSGNDLQEDEILEKAITGTYDIVKDDRELRKAPADFEKLRGDYPPRREFRAYTLVFDQAAPAVKRMYRRIGFKVL